MSPSIIFCMFSVKGLKCSPIINDVMGGGSDPSPRPYSSICDLVMFPPECLLLCNPPPPPPPDVPPLRARTTGPSSPVPLNLLGSEVLFSTGIFSKCDFAFDVISSATEAGLLVFVTAVVSVSMSRRLVDGKLVVRRGGWRTAVAEDGLSSGPVLVVCLRNGCVVMYDEEEDGLLGCCWWWFCLDCWIFWLSVPESHFSNLRAEKRLTRGGRVWWEREGEREGGR